METALSRRARSLTTFLTAIYLINYPSLGAAGDWTIIPRIGGQEVFTDNVLLTPTNRRADFITVVSPGISISGESSRLQATLDYSPSLAIFALTPGQDFIGHNLYGNATATIVP